jgi:undecaprenyl diphosphate synthase
MKLSFKSFKSAKPNHVAIIMDGNRRWAKKRGLPIIMGHQKVAEEVIEELIDYCLTARIKYLTLWAFSTQNWERDEQEINMLMGLFRKYLSKKLDQLNKKGVKLGVMGDLTKFDHDIQRRVKKGLTQTANNTKLVLTLGLNYGGRDELVRAFNKIMSQIKIKNQPITINSIKNISDKKKSNLLKKEITQATVNQFLDTNNLPNPDLIIRPGGEQRLSGFMLWQLYFSKVLMPDFGADQLKIAIKDYQRRHRRYGR